MSISGNSSRPGSAAGRRALILGSAVAAVMVAGTVVFIKGRGTEADQAKASTQKAGGSRSSVASNDSGSPARQSSRTAAAGGEASAAKLAEDARNQAANGKSSLPPTVAAVAGASGSTGSDKRGQLAGPGSVEETERRLKTLQPNLPLSTGEAEQDEAGNVFVGGGGSAGGEEPTPTPPLTPEENQLLREIEKTATKSGPEGAAWVERLEDNIFRVKAIEYVNYQWEKQDPQAAAKWYKKVTAKRF